MLQQYAAGAAVVPRARVVTDTASIIRHVEWCDYGGWSTRREIWDLFVDVYVTAVVVVVIAAFLFT